jgi:Flp pilus assembly protein CpaB
MRKSQILVVSLAILVGYVLASALNRTSAGQPPAPRSASSEPAEGRYRVAVSGVNPAAFVALTDTVTGRCWLG